jgi:hypothetical protein
MVRLTCIAALAILGCGARAAAPTIADARPIPQQAVDELVEALHAGTVASRYYDAAAGVDVVDLLLASYTDDEPWAYHRCGSRGADEVQRDTSQPPYDDARWSCEIEGAAALEVFCWLDTDGEYTPNVELYLRGEPLRLVHVVRTPNGVVGHDWQVEAANAIAQLAATRGCPAL